MKINTFNTGREYTEHGQRIAWTLLLREVGGGNIVAFVDADRGVSNVVRVPGHLFPENLTVLLQYDECAYLRNYLIPGDVEDALREAALEHGVSAEPAPAQFCDDVAHDDWRRDGFPCPACTKKPAPAQDEDIYEGTYTHLCELLAPHTVEAGGQLPASVCDAFQVLLDAFLARPALSARPVQADLERENSDLRAQCGGMQMEIDELRAAQTEQQPVGYANFRNGRFGSWLHPTEDDAKNFDKTALAGKPAGSKQVALYAGPIAQTEQQPVEQWQVRYLPGQKVEERWWQDSTAERAAWCAEANAEQLAKGLPDVWEIRKFYAGPIAQTAPQPLTEVTTCHECGSKSLTWCTQNVITTGVPQNRLNTNDVRCQFVLGCDECSETLKVIGADKVADRLNARPEVPCEN